MMNWVEEYDVIEKTVRVIGYNGISTIYDVLIYCIEVEKEELRQRLNDLYKGKIKLETEDDIEYLVYIMKEDCYMRIAVAMQGASDIMAKAQRLVEDYYNKKVYKLSLKYRFNNKDKRLVESRRNTLNKEIEKQLIDFTESYFEMIKEEIEGFHSEINNFIAHRLRAIRNSKSKDLVTEIDGESFFKIEKVFDYKEMQRFAINNNYKFKHSTGDHLIYEHSQTNKIVVIPAHTLGLGLSHTIQKQIIKNAKI